mmetsp:Transcript_31359/g.52308  ORF Transcript_31359/g.52308 Transcript_31359/m.52308 type:complete len:523 (+) Transcript_31359:73-1641(+)
MKVLAVALAALTGFSEAKKMVNKSELNRRLKNNLVNKQVLMRGAKPANEYTKRKLDGNEFEITGSYSIQFNSCISLTVQNQDIMEDANWVDMAANGDLISEKDYIMFNVCETDMCSYYADDEKMTFIAEVGTYFQAISQYLPTKIQQYCEACEENYDYCYAMYSGQQYYPEGYEEQQQDEEQQQEDNGEEEQQQDENADEEQQDNGEERKLKSKRKLQNGQLVKFIDCQMCADYECLDFQQSNSNGYYDENGDYVEAELDDAMEWLNGFSECSETYAYLDDYQLYSGLMCNADGDGLEIGLFLDEDCLMYTPKVAYADVMQSGDSTYYNMISDIVEFTFTNEGIECYDPEIVWYNEVDYYYQQMNGENQEEEQEEDNGEEPEAAEWCQEIVQQDTAVDLYDCAGYYPENNGDEEGDDYVNNYEWYQYELGAEDAEDIQAVCYVVKNLEGELHTSFNGDHAGLFNYKRNKNSVTAGGMSGGAVAGIVILVLVIVGAAAGAMMMKNKSGEDKKKPLISEGGQLA